MWKDEYFCTNYYLCNLIFNAMLINYYVACREFDSRMELFMELYKLLFWIEVRNYNCEPSFLNPSLALQDRIGWC